MRHDHVKLEKPMEYEKALQYLHEELLQLDI